MTGIALHGPADSRRRRQGPTASAVAAFGARPDELRPLPGGQGQTWSDGRLVLKPVGCVPEHAFVCDVYAAWSDATVRVPEPVHPPAAASWTVDGWGAHVLVPGRDARLLDELDLVRDVCDAFHAALADLPRPTFLDERRDPWSHGDRMAWEDEQPVGDPPTLAVIERLRARLAPVSSPSQVVHGDVLPNVLVHDRLPPSLIDWPVYHRPARFARAVAVTDAVTFRGGPLSLLDDWATGPDWEQVVIRAFLYRLGPTGVFALHERLRGNLVTHVERLVPVLDALGL